MNILGGLSDFLARMRLGAIAGLQFDGQRDLYKTFGYKKQLRHEDFLAKYLRQDVAQRIIDKPVNATWSDPPQVIGNDAFNTAWKELTKDNIIWSVLAKLDKFAGLGQFAVLLIGYDDGKDLEKPINTSRSNKILYYQPFLEGSVRVLEYDEDPKSSRFTRPTIYGITPGDTAVNRLDAAHKAMTRKEFRCHFTRLLHVADNSFENNILGHSRLEPIYNLLDDLLKTVGGSAETLWLTANRGLHIDVDKELELSPDDAADLSDELEEYQHNLRRIIRTRGVKVSPLVGNYADPYNLFDVQMSLISANSGIPKRVLMGSEAGQLASQQDRANWSIFIAERNMVFAEPFILRAFIQNLQASNVLPESDVRVEWPEAYKMSPLERAQTGAQLARSAANVTKAMMNSRECGSTIITVEEGRRLITFDKQMPVLSEKPEGTMLKRKGEGQLDEEIDPETQNPDGSPKTKPTDNPGSVDNPARTDTTGGDT